MHIFPSIIIFLSTANVPFTEKTTFHRPQKHSKVGFMHEISATHRYNCKLWSDIKPLEMHNVICPFSLSSIIPKSAIKALCLTGCLNFTMCMVKGEKIKTLSVGKRWQFSPIIKKRIWKLIHGYRESKGKDKNQVMSLRCSLRNKLHCSQLQPITSLCQVLLGVSIHTGISVLIFGLLHATWQSIKGVYG